MAGQHPRRTSRQDQARKRAIRAQAARTGVSYSVAARQMEAVGLRPGEMIATYGRTIYPTGHDAHRQRLIELRERRSMDERLADTRRAAVLPGGRAQHLVERFPPTRGRPGSKVGPLYHGTYRQELLTMLYVTIAVESPGLIPETGDLAWIAEMGEETALDMACAELDREARALLEREPATLWPAIERALALSENSPQLQLRQEATRLSALYRSMWAPRESADGEPYVDDPPFEGVRQILDVLLMVADDGHAPGTRVRMLASPHENRIATVVGAVWGSPGPPVAYRVQVEESTIRLTAETADLVVLADQESLAR
ncbi:hypothetical protein GCM10010170_050080 [Dactylosporangium salmoneum]|uniref:Uncharacterized protein n=2 Tax=Dactylosporangium salmoneum TaxID=53361 RepID=A0ABN3GNW7_9ACTN